MIRRTINSFVLLSAAIILRSFLTKRLILKEFMVKKSGVKVLEHFCPLFIKVLPYSYKPKKGLDVLAV